MKLGDATWAASEACFSLMSRAGVSTLNLLQFEVCFRVRFGLVPPTYIMSSGSPPVNKWSSSP
jgi:hypothetical protein